MQYFIYTVVVIGYMNDSKNLQKYNLTTIEIFLKQVIFPTAIIKQNTLINKYYYYSQQKCNSLLFSNI